MPGDSFKEFVLDQLGALPELRARAMFGAHGLWSAKIFGILDEGRLFFKIDGIIQN
jgi:TfoX/Sxy family transcriptional regulator of competence genes